MIEKANPRTIVAEIINGTFDFNRPLEYVQGITLTAANASKLLDICTPPADSPERNRKLSARRAVILAADMGDDWISESYPYIFGKSGYLYDGNTRMHAQVLARATLTNVTFAIGATTDFHKIVNTSREASLTERLVYRGLQLPKRVTPIANILHKLESKQTFVTQRPRATELEACIQRNQAELEEYAMMFPLRQGNGGAAIVAAVIFVAISSPEVAEEFANRFLNKVPVEANDIVMRFKNKLDTHHASSTELRRLTVLRALSVMYCMKWNRKDIRGLEFEHAYWHFHAAACKARPGVYEP
jgi:hypothetical protein